MCLAQGLEFMKITLAHLQTMIKTHLKLQKDQYKTMRSCTHKVPTVYSFIVSKPKNDLVHNA